MDIRRQMDQIYRDLPLDRIPWNLTEPPEILVDAVESGKIKPCQAVDLGCGAGNYSVWLARRGFDVTGLDISEKAISYAEELADKNGVECHFEAIDLLGDLEKYHSTFDFAFDWELLHHIFPEDRERYLDNVRRILRSGGLYLSICFSEADPDFGGEGKTRKTRIGTVLYFSSEDELRELYGPRFQILDLETAEIKGKYGPHLVNAAWLKRE